MHSEQSSTLDLLHLNQSIYRYVNGETDARWEILLPFLNHIRRFYMPGNNLRFAEQYEKVVGSFAHVPKDRHIVRSNRSFSDWEAEASQIGDKDYLKPVYQLQEYITNHFSADEIVGFYLHGSISTLDYVPHYSDFDTLVIIRKQVLQEPNWLDDFRKRLIRSTTFLYLLDPMQHHNHLILTEYDMLAYVQPIFPLELFRYATSLWPVIENLTFEVVNDFEALREALTSWMGYFNNLTPYSLGGYDSYALKQFVQSLLLLPAIFLQFKERRYSYKKFTFMDCKQYFAPDTWSLIERATQVRANCRFRSIYPYTFRKMLGLYVHPRLLHLLHRRVDRSIVHQIKGILGEDVQCAVQNVVNEIVSHVGQLA